MKVYYIIEIFALVFWSFQLAPQALQNYQRKSAEGLSPLLMLFWTLGSVCTAIYNIGEQFEVLFIIQPNLFMLFSVLCYFQCYWYNNSKQLAIILTCLLVVFLIVVEVIGSIFLLRLNNTVDNDSNVIAAFQTLGIASTIFFGIGFLPQFYEIYLRGHVEGVSRLFLCVDMTGAVLSIVSLALQPHFNPVSGTCYAIVFVCDFIILLLSFIIADKSDNTTSYELPPVISSGSNDDKDEVNNMYISRLEDLSTS